MKRPTLVSLKWVWSVGGHRGGGGGHAREGRD